MPSLQERTRFLIEYTRHATKADQSEKSSQFADAPSKQMLFSFKINLCT